MLAVYIVRSTLLSLVFSCERYVSSISFISMPVLMMNSYAATAGSFTMLFDLTGNPLQDADGARFTYGAKSFGKLSPRPAMLSSLFAHCKRCDFLCLIRLQLRPLLVA